MVALPATKGSPGRDWRAPCEFRPFTILSLILVYAYCAATRIAFFNALEFDDPCPTMQTSLIPQRGAPPYSAYSRRFLKSSQARRESKNPTCELIVDFSDSFRRNRTVETKPSETFNATLPMNPSQTMTSTVPL